MVSLKGKFQIAPKSVTPNYRKERKEKKTFILLLICPLIQDIVSTAFVSPSLQSALSPLPQLLYDLQSRNPEPIKNTAARAFLLYPLQASHVTYIAPFWRDAAGRDTEDAAAGQATVAPEVEAGAATPIRCRDDVNTDVLLHALPTKVVRVNSYLDLLV